ncbi:leukocyte surface antigen CD53-like isoform X1 [Bombus pascuorum]|uniref:leukocyte surface antigen CD53-like isoform X1 n=1 Tax=Bombus pascuorum TaxID=65598 RepID=UPI00298E87E1|nr:leukocyte surface antigen CD53-like isoform X1 [Bombus pascuorum]
MNWNKFFTGTADHGDYGNEEETETEDDENVTDSTETVSTDKKSHFLGMHFHKLSHNDLSQQCIKLAFLIINITTLIAGIVGIVTSIWIFTDNRIMTRLIDQRFHVTSLLFISFIGSLVSSLGILGVLRRRRKFLNIYALCYLTFLCIIFISAIMSFWIFEEITKRIQFDMNTAIEGYHSSSWSREAWDNTHRYLKCCGVKSAMDWAKYHVEIPTSCCSRSIGECLQMTEAVAYKSGCLKNAILLLKSHIHTISISVLLIFLTIVSRIIPCVNIRDLSKYVDMISGVNTLHKNDKKAL